MSRSSIALVFAIIFVHLCWSTIAGTSNLTTPYWEKIITNGFLPSRFLHHAFFDGQRLFTYGGTDISQSQPSEMSLLNFVFSPPTVSTIDGAKSESGADVGRSNGAFLSLFNHTRLFIYGGREFDSKLSSVVQFDKELFTNSSDTRTGWQVEVPFVNGFSSGEINHAALPNVGTSIAWDGIENIYFFGGRSDGGNVNTLSRLYFGTPMLSSSEEPIEDPEEFPWVWTTLDAINRPSRRFDAAMTYVSVFPNSTLQNPVLVLFGGVFQVSSGSDPIMQTTSHIADLTDNSETAVWRTNGVELANLNNNPPSPRAGNQFVNHPDGTHAYIFGGYAQTVSSGPFTVFDDLWRLDFTGFNWTQIIVNLGDSGNPPATGMHTFVPAFWRGEESIFVFGGIHSDQLSTNQLWKLVLKECPLENCFFDPFDNFGESPSFESGESGADDEFTGVIVGVVVSVFCICLIIACIICIVVITNGALLFVSVAVISFFRFVKQEQLVGFDDEVL